MKPVFFGFLLLCFFQKAVAANSQPLSLEDCVNLALRQNPQVLKAQQEIKRTRGLIVEARAQALPHLKASGFFDAQDSSRFESIIPGAPLTNDTSWQVSLRLTQLVYAGGKVNATLDIAKLLDQAAFLEFQATLDRVLLEVRKAFANVLLNQGLIQVAQQSVRLLEQELSNQKRRLAAGTVPRFNVLRAEVELANARPALIRAQNNLRISLVELGKLLALENQASSNAPSRSSDLADLAVTGELATAPIPLSLEGALGQALALRPELRGLEKQVNVQQRQIDVDRSGLLPKLSIFGGYDYISTRFGEFGTENNGVIGGVQGEWMFFDGLEAKGRLEQTRSRITSARIDVEDARRQVELEVRRAFLRTGEARALIESQKKNIESAEESLRLARARFDAGAGTQLDVLNAQVALTQARTNQLQARYDDVVAQAELERATSTAFRFADASKIKEEEAPVFRAPAPLQPVL